MTEPAGGPQPADTSSPSATEPADVLDSFKTDAGEADNENVHDAIGGRPRLNWSPVTDGGGRAPTENADARSSFHFDLGGALARLGDPQTNQPSEQQQTPAAVVPPPPPAPPAVAPVAPAVPAAEHALPQRAPAVRRPVVDQAPPPPPPPPPPVVAPAAVAPSPVQQPLPQRAPVTAHPETVAPPLDPLPRRGERPEMPVEPGPVAPREPASAPYVTARRSVFDDTAATSGTTQPLSMRAPSAPIVPPPVAPTRAAQPAPSLSSAQAGPLLPTLPAAKPGASPMYTPPIESAPSAPDVNALRSAQLRASRQQARGKMFSRTMLALFLIGGLIAAALVFGRRYLFPTEWDQSLTPIVNEIQTERGVEFEHTVGLVKQPSADYALTIGRLVVDDGWVGQVPVWRALGLTTGEPTVDGIAPALAAARLAVYDPDADRIYTSADVSPEAAAADLRLALEQAFAAQQSTATTLATEDSNTGFLGVSPPRQIIDAAVDRYIAERDTESTATSSDAAAVASGPSSALPLPIEYELRAIDALGEPLLSATGVDPVTMRFGSAYPDDVGARLDDGARPTASGALQVGDASLAPPTALGVDDWSLVWGSRLPQATVDQLATIVVADSFRPVDRGGLTCAIAVFETANPTDAGSVLAAMQAWTAAAPAGSQASVVQLAETRVQLSACDPGAEAATVPQAGDVDALINRQLTRLAG